MSVKVGNDVIDLDEGAIADSHLRPRLVARVCAESERTTLAASPAPKQLLWSYFAAKEAAFKVVCKLGPRPVFAHRKFVVSADLRRVTYEAWTFPLWIEAGDGFVHAVVSTEAVRPEAGVDRRGEGDEPSAAARTLLLHRLGLRGVEVVRDPIPGSWDGFGPPRLSVGARDISLSHDGRFVGFAAAPQHQRSP